MKKGLIQINPFATKENTVESYICFKKFIDFLEEKVRTEKSIRTHFYRFVLDRFHRHPELIQGMGIMEVNQYDEVLDLIATIVLPLVDDENEALVSLTGGVSSQVFYATEAFINLFEARTQAEQDGRYWVDAEAGLQLHLQIQYYLVLQKVYGVELPQKRELQHSFFNPVTGLYQYFRLNIDTRFVEIKAKTLHDPVNPHSINACFEYQDNKQALENLIPLSNYIAKGFSIVTLTDITAQQAVEQMSKLVVNIDKEKAPENFIHITRLMQTILGSNLYSFGIMPFFTVNKRAAILYENFNYSIIVKASANAGIDRSVFTRYTNHYIKHPRIIIHQPGDARQALPVPLLKALKASGIGYYVLAPVYFNEALIGILEVGARAGTPALTEMQMGKLKPAMPYLSQLLKAMIEKFNVTIDAIVKDKFTGIQPSVQWKFNEAAWHYFRHYNIEHRSSTVEKISFKQVYPLYGAVDIRNSTIERNKALREDLHGQLEWLMRLLNRLNADQPREEMTAMAKTCRHWLNKLAAYVSIEDELELNDFLFNTVHPLLHSLTGLPASIAAEIGHYFLSIEEEHGSSFEKRRGLENSIQLLNTSIGKHFDLFKQDLQQYYPCYFEKFRTDGVEYDIYIGQSIAPKIPFTIHEVEKLRIWQLQSMAAVARLTHALLAELEVPLQTTQLIFVNARAIDISFRNDERRFDVEGAYNIRYHIIKKRIDKVNIRGSLERLTQPGKIAVVYFNERDAAEYLVYIQQLQENHVLLNDLEHLELEELQGVSGLKALRVGVQLNNAPAFNGKGGNKNQLVDTQAYQRQ